MSLRKRERINRNPDKQRCGACLHDMFDHQVTVKRVAGEYIHICTSCRIELKNGRLADYLDQMATVNDDVEVNQDLVQNLRDDQ